MNPETWAAVDNYFFEMLIAPGDYAALDTALQTSVSAGLPAINVAPNQGKLLHLLARAIGARRILEIGTLGGYSTIWLARALPLGGKVVTLEVDPRHAQVARENLERAGVSGTVDLRVGRAIETLPRLAAEPGEPLDFILSTLTSPARRSTSPGRSACPAWGASLSWTTSSAAEH